MEYTRPFYYSLSSPPPPKKKEKKIHSNKPPTTPHPLAGKEFKARSYGQGNNFSLLGRRIWKLEE